MKPFYITTPLYYVNDIPHVGHAYSTVMADILSRYHKLFGSETFFLTGTDEHGQKCEQAAEKNGKTAQQHCDDMVVNFKEAWKEFNIDYDLFFRTTDDFHKTAVQKALQKIHDQGDIYSDTYEGWYSVSEEIFYTEKDLVDGKSPEGKEVTKVSEKNYFFKMSKFQQQLIDHINNNPEFIKPESRKNEVLGFLKQELGDLCISRPKNRLKWGVEIPFDKDYVTYVWFDALLNYATGVGFLQDGKQDMLDKWWNSAGAHHIIGKDILTTHAVYWTTMLLALGMPLPKTIFAHGWILNKGGGKMSKSEGDVINPMDFKDIVGIDGLRYFFVRDIHFGNDAPISKELVFNRLNSELANNLGNMQSRVCNLIAKYFDGKSPKGWHETNDTLELIKVAKGTAGKVKADIERMAPSYALEHIVHLLNTANKYLEDNAPWKQAKEDVEAAGKTLYVALECLRIASSLLLPVMPEKCSEVLTRISSTNPSWDDLSEFGIIAEGTEIVKGNPIFPRLA